MKSGGFERPKRQSTESMTRRGFLDMMSGGLSNVVLFGFGARWLAQSVEQELAADRRVDVLRLSRGFRDELAPLVAVYEKDADVMLDRALGSAERDGRALIDLFREEIMNPTNEKIMIIPERVRMEIVHFVAGQLAKECSYIEQQPNHASPSSFIQITDDTARQIGISPDTVTGNPKLQARAMGEVFALHYARLEDRAGRSLAKIRDHHFDMGRRQAQFEVAFIAPALFTAYFAGPDNVIPVIKRFADNPPFGIFLGYDIFRKMCAAAFAGNWERGFGENAKNYFAEITAWTTVLYKELEKRAAA